MSSEERHARKGEDEGRKSRLLKFLSLHLMIESTWKNKAKRHDTSKGFARVISEPNFRIVSRIEFYGYRILWVTTLMYVDSVQEDLIYSQYSKRGEGERDAAFVSKTKKWKSFSIGHRAEMNL